jgi:hypothetical protein
MGEDMLSKIQPNMVVQGLLQGDESGTAPLIFFITASYKDRGIVTSLHIGGSPFSLLRPGTRLHMVVEEGENSIRFDASVLDLRDPDGVDFMVLSSASISGKREYARLEDYLCYECDVIKGSPEEAKERFRLKGNRRVSPQAASLAAFARRDDRMTATEIDREFVRLLIGLDAKVDAIIRFLSIGDRAGLSFFAPRWISLSGSGVRLVIPAVVEESDHVDLRVQIPDMLSTPVTALGKVVRAVPLKGGGGKEFDVAMGFVLIGEEDRTRIVKYVGRRMRDQERRAEKKGVGGSP